jgi:hypothetical protein
MVTVVEIVFAVVWMLDKVKKSSETAIMMPPRRPPGGRATSWRAGDLLAMVAGDACVAGICVLAGGGPFCILFI